MLIVLGGLPGTGKTTLARKLARRLSALHVRIDSIEQAIVASGLSSDPGPAGYFVGYSVAADNLRLGLTVIADSVNSLEITRDAWIKAAKSTGSAVVEIEVICSDVMEHRRRIEMRKADIPGHQLPTWQDVLARQSDPWLREHLIVDTCRVTIEEAVECLIEKLSMSSASFSPKPL